MYVGNTYLNYLQFLLQFLFLINKYFILFFKSLHHGLPVFIKVVVSNLKKDDKSQDIRTHKYHAHVWDTQLQYQNVHTNSQP